MNYIKLKRLQYKSIDDLQEIAKLTGIKNYDNLTKGRLNFESFKIRK